MLTVPEKPICCRTRTGKKVHRAWSGSSVTFCGHWMKFTAERTRIDQAAAVARGYGLCEKCFEEKR